MLIRLKKISDTKHRLELVRDDGTRESIELVSRSFLRHDLLHYSVEANGKLQHSFWGLLASGKTLAELHDAMGTGDRVGNGRPPPTEAAITEAIVGVLTNVVAEHATARAAIGALTRLFEAQEREVPNWLTADFVEGVREHMRKLMGRWRALPYGSEMELTFPGTRELSGSDEASRQQKARPGYRGGPARNRSLT